MNFGKLLIDFKIIYGFSFFNKLSKHRSISAGTNVFEKEDKSLHEFVIKCMVEEGYDLSKNRRKLEIPYPNEK